MALPPPLYCGDFESLGRRAQNAGAGDLSTSVDYGPAIASARESGSAMFLVALLRSFGSTGRAIVPLLHSCCDAHLAVADGFPG